MRRVSPSAILLVLATSAAAQQPASGHVKLRLVDPAGGPVTSARIELAPGGRSRVLLKRLALTEWSLDPKNAIDGAFLLPDLPADRLRFRVLAPPFAPMLLGA